MFTVIKSHENHHVIIDKHSEILGYHYHIKDNLLRTLNEMTEDLPYMRVNTSNRENYLTYHYTVWYDYSMEPYESAEYRKELLASEEWCKKNKKLFEYLFDGFQMISPMTYVKYGGARSYLQAHHNLKLLYGIWFRVVINEQVTSSTSTHLDFSDLGFNCV
jgi:hypothetical protein